MTVQGFLNSVKGSEGDNSLQRGWFGNFAGEIFYRVLRIWGGVILTIRTFSANIEHRLKSNLAWPVCTKSTTAKMKFLLGCNMKIVIQSMGEWTLAGGGGGVYYGMGEFVQVGRGEWVNFRLLVGTQRPPICKPLSWSMVAFFCPVFWFYTPW